MKSHRYLIMGSPRAQLASAILEYRVYAETNPDCPLAAKLLDVAREVHMALHEEREVLRAMGGNGKPCEHVRVSPEVLATIKKSRRSRLARLAAAQ